MNNNNTLGSLDEVFQALLQKFGVNKMTELEKQNLLLKILWTQHRGQPNQKGNKNQQHGNVSEDIGGDLPTFLRSQPQRSQHEQEFAPPCMIETDMTPVAS